MFSNCSNPASAIFFVESSVYTRNILSFIPAEDIDQIKLAFTCQGRKHTWGSVRWMQPTWERTFCRCIQLRSCFAENDATDFRMWDEKRCNRLQNVGWKMMQQTSECGTNNDATDFRMWNEKWCNRLLRLLSTIAFCWHIIEVRIEWEGELGSELASALDGWD